MTTDYDSLLAESLKTRLEITQHWLDRFQEGMANETIRAMVAEHCVLQMQEALDSLINSIDEDEVLDGDTLCDDLREIRRLGDAAQNTSLTPMPEPDAVSSGAPSEDLLRAMAAEEDEAAHHGREEEGGLSLGDRGGHSSEQPDVGSPLAAGAARVQAEERKQD